jgi:hypothetical protein
MPKIPTFTTESRIAAETPSVAQTPQISPSMNIASALAPATKGLMDYYAREKFTADKTEALELENKAMVDLLNLRSELEKNANPDLSIKSFQDESNTILENYSTKANNSRVKSLFKNNFLAEIQKSIPKVNESNRLNLEQSRINGDNLKITRMITDAKYSKNRTQDETLNSDMGLIYDNQRKENIIDEDTYQFRKANIPALVESISVKKDMSDNPIETFKKLQDMTNYPNVIGDLRDGFVDDAKQKSRPIIKEQMDNYLTAAADGKDIGIDIDAVKTILKPNEYENFLERHDSIKDSIGLIKQINLTPVDENQKIIEGIELRDESYGLDKKKKEIILEAAKNQQKALETDPVNFIINTNDKIKNAYNDFALEEDESTKRVNKKLYLEKLIETQKNLKLNKSEIRVMSKTEADNIVENYMNSDADGRLNILNSINADYGNYNDYAIMELSKAGLPMTAEFSSYFNNIGLAKKLLSFDTKGERDNLKQFLQDSVKGTATGKSFNDVRDKIATSDTISKFESAIFSANKIDTGIATKKTNDIRDVLTFYAINEMRANGIDKFDTAIESSINLIKNNFDIEEDYFIPRIFNGKPLDQFQIERIKQKVNFSKKYILDKVDLQTFKSTNPEISSEDLNAEFRYQLQNSSKWVNAPDGSGLIFGISLNDGSFAPVLNKDGKNIEINFEDKSNKVNGINLDISEVKTKIRDTEMEVQSLIGLIPR